MKIIENNQFLLLSLLIILTGLTALLPFLAGLSIVLGVLALATAVYSLLGFYSRTRD